MYCSIKIILKITKPSYDHYANLSFIKDIQLNNHRFLLRNSNVLFDKNFAYPVFFHWLLSFFPFEIIKEKYFRLNISIELINSLVIVTMILALNQFADLATCGMLFLLIVTNPFNRFLWNAKVSGISSRNFGLLTIYLFIFYFSSNLFQTNIYLRIAGFSFLGLIVILSSQFATQFLLIFSCTCIFFGKNLPAISLPVSFFAFFILMPGVFTSYIKGQIIHKKNWIAHISKIDLFRYRPSIYRDFVYDFYKNRSLKYFLNNPVIEVITGFPLLVILLYKQPQIIWHNPIIFSGIFSFLFTSLGFMRAFGEPQRYIEMIFPVIIITTFKLINSTDIFAVIIYGVVFFIFHFNTFAVFWRNEMFNEQTFAQIKKLINNGNDGNKAMLFGNNWSMQGHFLPEKNMNILMPVFTVSQQMGFAIKDILPEHLFSIDRKVIFAWIKNQNPGWFFLDDYYWPRNEFESAMVDNGVKFSFQEQFRPVLLYKLIYE